MIASEWFIASFIALGALLLLAVSRAQARTRKAHQRSRSNARVVREVQRMAVRQPDRIIEKIE